MYKLLGKDGKEYLSEQKGQFGGHRKLKIYGRLDCPSALRYIAAGQYVQHRVFFADEVAALSAGYRPCGVCMKEHYNLWKGGRLMTHALEVIPILSESAVCSIRLANSGTKEFTTDKLKDTPIPDGLKEGIENCQMKIEGDNYSKAVHCNPPFSYILCLAKNYKIASALTVGVLGGDLGQVGVDLH